MRAHALRMSFLSSNATGPAHEFFGSRKLRLAPRPSARVFWQSQAAACSPGLLTLDPASGTLITPWIARIPGSRALPGPYPPPPLSAKTNADADHAPDGPLSLRVSVDT